MPFFQSPCDKKNKINLYNNFTEQPDDTSKIDVLINSSLDELNKIERQDRMCARKEGVAASELIKLAIAHKNAEYERNILHMGDKYTLAYPQYKNWQLAEKKNWS